MIKNHRVYVVCLLLSLTCIIYAQEAVVPTFSVINKTEQTHTPDTVIEIQLTETDLEGIGSIRDQFEKQNETYASPVPPSQKLLRFLNKEKLEMSPEARYWVNYIRDISSVIEPGMTFRDTVIVNPLFVTPVFRGMKTPEGELFYNPDLYKQPEPLAELMPQLKTSTEYSTRKMFEKKITRQIERNNPDLFQYSQRDIPKDIVAPVPIQKDVFKDLPLVVTPDVKVEDVDAPIRFIPDRLYWRSAFESAIQFSQNYISKNWNKGGSSTLNLFTKHHIKYDYNRDKVQFTNEMELKASIYTAPKDTTRNYKMGEDLFRIHSNFGYKAFNKWYYTFDAEFKTSMFRNYKENSEIMQAALLSPFSITLGLGMKYDLDKKFPNDKHKKLKLALNMAPVTYTYLYSIEDDETKIDLGRHSFPKDPETGKYKNHLSQMGSSVRADFSISFNRNVSWQSRLYYFTNYDRVLTEFENTLTMAISRYFSTRIYVYLRYDDGVAPSKKDTDLGYFQINELLSFGFNYKW